MKEPEIIFLDTTLVDIKKTVEIDRTSNTESHSHFF